MQCLSNKRCILCGNSKNVYISEKNNESFPINCTSNEPEKGYYSDTKYGHTIFFRCIEGCDECPNANICSNCHPHFYLSDDKTKCIERIPHCKKYDENSEDNEEEGQDEEGYEGKKKNFIDSYRKTEVEDFSNKDPKSFSKGGCYIF